MGANKTKINKQLLQTLVKHTDRTPAEIKVMHTIFLQHFPNGKIESPQDLYCCLQKFSLSTDRYDDPKTIERIYRLFCSSNPNLNNDSPIDFFTFMVASNILERGTPAQKIDLYFKSFDVNNDHVITRDDLEECLPRRVESQHLIQQLLRQWDVNRDGVVSIEDFRRYIEANPDLSSLFFNQKNRLRADSITAEMSTDVNPSTDNNISTNIYNVNRGMFATYQ